MLPKRSAVDQNEDVITGKIPHLDQTIAEKAVLYLNLGIICTGAIVLYVYFSINPFTSEEIANLRSDLNISIIR